MSGPLHFGHMPDYVYILRCIDGTFYTALRTTSSGDMPNIAPATVSPWKYSVEGDEVVPVRIGLEVRTENGALALRVAPEDRDQALREFDRDVLQRVHPAGTK